MRSAPLLRFAASLAGLRASTAAITLTLFAACRLTLAADAPEHLAPRETVLRIHGSDTIGATLIGDLLSAFLKSEGWTDVSRVAAPGGGSYETVGRPAPDGKLAGAYVEISDPGSAFSALDQGFADIVMSSRRIRPAEVRQLARLGDLTSATSEHLLALDAVAVITNAANPIESLTLRQLKEIFLRRVTSWQEVGGSGPIHVYARDSNSGTHATFQAVVLDDQDLPSDAPRERDNQSLANAVATDARGIGVVTLALAGPNRVIALSDGKPQPRLTRPGPATIRNGEYPISRRLYLYTAATPENALARRFLAFALGPVGQAIVTKSGFVSPVADAAPPAQPERVATPAPTPVPMPTPPVADARPAPAPTPAAEPPERARRARPQPTPAPPKPRATPRNAAPAAPRPAATPEDNPSSSGGG